MQTTDQKKQAFSHDKAETFAEQKHLRKSVQGRLIWFFVCMLGAILFSQTLVTYVINRFFLPGLQTSFLQSGSWNTDLTGLQLTLLLFGLCLIMLLQTGTHLFPFTAPLASSLQERLSHWIGQNIPQISQAAIIRDLSGWDGFLLILFSFGLLLLELLPFVIFGWLYIRFVLRTTGEILQKDEDWYRETDKNRNLMLADIAHDIRNPMTTVAGYAQALDEGLVRDPEKQHEYLAAIRRKSDRVNNLINTLFEYATLNSSGFTLNKQSVDLCELLRETAADLYTDAEEKGIGLDMDIPETPFSVPADPVQLSRAFANLIGNAVRYNPPGTTLLLSLRTDKTGDGDTHIVFADTGQIIPEDVAGRIFEPFSRGDASRRTDGGSGLGLSITEAIVRLHGWELSLETSFPGYTKAFVIRIPW